MARSCWRRHWWRRSGGWPRRPRRAGPPCRPAPRRGRAPPAASWEIGASWSGGTVPTSTDHVCITTAGTYTVTLPDGGRRRHRRLADARRRVGRHARRSWWPAASSSEVDSLTATEGIEIACPRRPRAGRERDRGRLAGRLRLRGHRQRRPPSARSPARTETHTIWGDVVNTGTFQLDQPIFVEGAFTNEGVLHVNHVLHVNGHHVDQGRHHRRRVARRRLRRAPGRRRRHRRRWRAAGLRHPGRRAQLRERAAHRGHRPRRGHGRGRHGAGPERRAPGHRRPGHHAHLHRQWTTRGRVYLRAGHRSHRRRSSAPGPAPPWSTSTS